jgi:hypothetical protein
VLLFRLQQHHLLLLLLLLLQCCSNLFRFAEVMIDRHMIWFNEVNIGLCIRALSIVTAAYEIATAQM